MIFKPEIQAASDKHKLPDVTALDYLLGIVLKLGRAALKGLTEEEGWRVI